MNVLLILIIVILMLHVLTLLAIFYVLVTLDMKEMENRVKVCGLLEIYILLIAKSREIIDNFI